LGSRATLLVAGHLREAVKEYERKQLLERVDREAATVGASVPEEIELDGETLPLSEFVFEVRSSEGGESRERVEWAKKKLRRARLDRRQQIEAGEISFETGEDLAAEIVGIDRALNALESLGEADLQSQAERAETADTKRWFSFLKQALGDTDDTTARGPR